MSLFTSIWNSYSNLPPCPLWMRWPARIIRVALAVIFIVSGILKVLDAQSFMATLPLYNIPDWMVPLGALIPPIEVAIGVAFLVRMAPRVTTAVAQAMLLMFSVLLVVGMAGGRLDSCGCFGPLLEQSPGSALLRNIVLMLLTVVYWRYYAVPRTVWRPWQVGLTAAVLLVLGTLTGYTIHTPQVDPSQAHVGEFFPEEGFGKLAPELIGRQLVFVFAADCHDCWNAVANVKALAADTTYAVFGVTASDPHEIGWFANEFDTNFKIYAYNPKLFYTAFRTWPALYYLEDGLIMGKVEDVVPSSKTLEEVHMPEWR